MSGDPLYPYPTEFPPEEHSPLDTPIARGGAKAAAIAAASKLGGMALSKAAPFGAAVVDVGQIAYGKMTGNRALVGDGVHGLKVQAVVFGTCEGVAAVATIPAGGSGAIAAIPACAALAGVADTAVTVAPGLEPAALRLMHGAVDKAGELGSRALDFVRGR